MKVRVSATIEENTDIKLEKFLKNSKYRNKSHFIEEAILNFLELENEK
jgi:metal-responsive CopG/Arc/MetJ family transcriptional regulator